jgi:hypothetical protein
MNTTIPTKGQAIPRQLSVSSQGVLALKPWPPWLASHDLLAYTPKRSVRRRRQKRFGTTLGQIDKKRKNTHPTKVNHPVQPASDANAQQSTNPMHYTYYANVMDVNEPTEHCFDQTGCFPVQFKP